ncbi:MAG: Rpn family recombination-promoting nuclease/putative transposase, partial [Anaerolineaceae bacterium]|nr:Rpn family recombination-promoting nuclease/putative transposase [Anaerolineaceae bacterium]
MAKKTIKGKIPGQGQPADAATDLFWRDNRNFAEVFTKAVFNGVFVNPDQLVDQNVAESTMLRMNNGSTTSLKQTRDVIKSLTSGGAWLVILGIENQTHIDFLMPFRVWELNFINVARQVNEIRKKHQEERKAIREAKEKGEEVEERELSEEEILSGFYRDDRLTPVITLVIYYGKEEWKTPKKLSDLFKQTPFTEFA